MLNFTVNRKAKSLPITCRNQGGVFVGTGRDANAAMKSLFKVAGRPTRVKMGKVLYV